LEKFPGHHVVVSRKRNIIQRSSMTVECPKMKHLKIFKKFSQFAVILQNGPIWGHFTKWANFGSFYKMGQFWIILQNVPIWGHFTKWANLGSFYKMGQFGVIFGQKICFIFRHWNVSPNQNPFKKKYT